MVTLMFKRNNKHYVLCVLSSEDFLENIWGISEQLDAEANGWGLTADEKDK